METVEEAPADRLEWGNLPSYLQSLQRRGAQIVVPPRYQKFFEAYVKRSSGDGK